MSAGSITQCQTNPSPKKSKSLSKGWIWQFAIMLSDVNWLKEKITLVRANDSILSFSTITSLMKVARCKKVHCWWCHRCTDWHTTNQSTARVINRPPEVHLLWSITSQIQIQKDWQTKQVKRWIFWQLLAEKSGWQHPRTTSRWSISPDSKDWRRQRRYSDQMKKSTYYCLCRAGTLCFLLRDSSRAQSNPPCPISRWQTSHHGAT